MGMTMFPVLKITLLLLSTSIHILGDKDVPPQPVDPCTIMNCEECEDCADDCLIFNCTNCREEFVITRSCALAMLTAAGVVVPVAMGVLGLFGFAAAGVSSGSLAALWQSTMAGVVVKGGLFALLQSIAAAGFSFSGAAIVSGATGAAMCKFCGKFGSLTGTDMRCSSQINCTT